ncbi:hypothetical protein TIFTF001_013892 [Ficus carica]|uniref:Uncharacterized protein n=1 Tax=Ficus carica TaxID=3494 RepID=A0AA88D3G6_FICCA|nr:hypothetical protein TIFTF001_013892 [Ficus carica]
MSITNSCLLLLFLLCLSLHACNSRRLGSIANTPQVKKSLFFIKDDEGKTGVDEIRVSEVKHSRSLSKERGDDNTPVKTKIEEKGTENLKDGKASRDISKRGGKGSAVASATTKSHVSVSWRVPHKKRGEKQPGFNLDYSPPKTHPPSHN